MSKTKTITISEESYQKIKDQLLETESFDISAIDDMIGKKFFFRLVNFHMLGKVTKRVGNFLILDKSSWVAESARFMDTIMSGDINELEPTGDGVGINIDHISDFFPWKHELPTQQK